MKKISTAAAAQIRNISEQRLTIGLDLGDRWSWYCLLDEVGEVLRAEPGTATGTGTVAGGDRVIE
jgi:transposase